MTTGTPTPDLLAGRYRLLEPLGSGGMATVYRAWDTQREVFRAVKILDRRVANNDRVRRRLLDEAHIMARLQHPNVVTLYEAGSDGDRLYLVMELMTGGSLQDRVAEAPLPPRMAAQVIIGVLAALQLAHDNGVVHRDVKPHNLLLDGEGNTKVTDFGIARLEDGGMTRTGAILGTLAYMPPEQKLSARKVDARADLYAAGASLHALLTGREPHDLYAAALDDATSRELYESVPAELAPIIRQATAFRPEDRYASASAMSAALASAVSSLPPDPPSEPLVSSDRLQQSRAQARLGPTLMSVTEVGENTQLVQMVAAVVPKPPLSSPPDEGRSWGVALGLAAVLVAAAGLAAAMYGPGGRPAATPGLPPVPPPTLATAIQGPIRDTGDEAISADAPRARRAAARTPPPEPAEEDPETSPLTERVGNWELQTWAGDKRGRVYAVASIAAADPVTPSSGEPDRPALLVQCLNGSPGLALRTRLGGFGDGDKPGTVSVDLAVDGQVEHLRGTQSQELPGDVAFSRVGGVWDALLNARQLAVVYPQAGGPPLRARFEVGDTTRIREALAECR